MVQTNNGGLPVQEISGGVARNEAINKLVESNERQLSLIGGKKRRRIKLYMKGGTNNLPDPSPISPPVVPNTGSSAETRGSQQESYNKLAELSGSVNEQSRYDTVGGRKIRSRKYMKSKKYKKSGKKRKNRKNRKTKKIK